MNRILLSVLPLLAGAAAAQTDAPDRAATTPLPAGAPPGMALIDQADLKAHASFLAADERGGRYTGTPGQEQAAEYIEKHFKSLGLVPLGGRKKSYFQEYPVERTYLDPKGTRIAFGGKTYKKHFAVLSVKKNTKVRAAGQFVFCQTGNPSNLPKSLKRKIPVVVLKSPAGGPRGGMRGSMVVNRASQVARRAGQLGAKVAVFCVVTENANVMDAMNYSALLPGKHILRFNKKGRANASGKTIPMVFLPPETSRKLIAKLGWDIDGGGAMRQVKKRAKASGRVNLAVKYTAKFKVKNVCAMLKGTSKSGEAIVFSAHMDHMGTRMDGDAFNGADDNASGTSGLLELAQAFAKGGAPPRRSILFLAVSGEELGLWGSEYYADNPTWSTKRIVADINIDMIGRNSQQPLMVTPSHAHNKFSTLVQNAAGFAKRLGISLASGDTYYQRSDHYNFAKKGIPVVFFCDGEHADYHKVTDHADKLDFAKMERITRLAYWTGLDAANAKGRPRTIGRQSGWTK